MNCRGADTVLILTFIRMKMSVKVSIYIYIYIKTKNKWLNRTKDQLSLLVTITNPVDNETSGWEGGKQI